MASDIALHRTFGQRFRVAALTLWLPIVILAVLPIFAFAVIGVVRDVFSLFEAASAAVSSWGSASEGLTLFGGLLLGGWIVYTVLSPSARTLSGAHLKPAAAAIIGALATSLSGSHFSLTILPWVLVVVVELVNNLLRQHHKERDEHSEETTKKWRL
jgi:hypothetical protein